MTNVFHVQELPPISEASPKAVYTLPNGVNYVTNNRLHGGLAYYWLTEEECWDEFEKEMSGLVEIEDFEEYD